MCCTHTRCFSRFTALRACAGSERPSSRLEPSVAQSTGTAPSVPTPLCQPGLRHVPPETSDLRAGMESFPEMTNKVTALVRATGDPKILVG